MKAELGPNQERNVKVEYIPLDLSSFQSTLQCVHSFKEKNIPLHILVNNAAIAFTPYSKW
jgi:short-subunit dehydrogenase